MKVTTEEIEQCEVLLTIEIEPQQEQDLLKKAARRIAKQVRVPGFRPGKAPFNVIVRRFGMEAVQQEMLEHSADSIIQKALKEANVEPYARMDLENVDWNPLTVKVKVPTEPKVELPNYREIRLDYEEITVTEEDIAERLANLQDEHATWVPVERPSEVGDLITMSVVEKDGDTVLAGEDAVEYELTLPDEEDAEIEAETADNEEEGESSETPKRPFQPDLTTPLLGLSAGDEKSFSIAYPDDFDDDRYAGKEITFEVKVSSIKEKEVDPLDDEFAKLVSEFDTLEALKADIEKAIREQRVHQQDMEIGNDVLEKVVEEATIIWPKALEDENIEQEIESYERRISAYGISLENYLAMENKTKEDFEQETRKRVVERLKRNLVLSEIAQTEKLEVSEMEILNHAKFLADISGQGDRLWRSIISSQAQQNLIANDLVVNKVINWLSATAKGEEPWVKVEEPEAEETDDSDSAPVEAEVQSETSVEEVGITESSSQTIADEDEDQTEEASPAEVKS